MSKTTSGRPSEHFLASHCLISVFLVKLLMPRKKNVPVTFFVSFFHFLHVKHVGALFQDVMFTPRNFSGKTGCRHRCFFQGRMSMSHSFPHVCISRWFGDSGGRILEPWFFFFFFASSASVLPLQPNGLLWNIYMQVYMKSPSQALLKYRNPHLCNRVFAAEMMVLMCGPLG